MTTAMSEAMDDLAGLPGAAEIERGVRDLNAGRPTVQALLVAAAATRLRELGLPVADTAGSAEPEIALYDALGRECDDPYARYNALRRQLDSFVSALERRRSRRAASTG
jgi:hypothetical protein